MAKIVVGKKDTRIVPIKAIEPLDNDKTVEHRIKLTITVLPNEDWRPIPARWDELGRMTKLDQIALQNGRDEVMTDDERREAREPAIESIKHLIIDADVDIENADGETLHGVEKIDAMVKVPWLASEMFDAVVAANGGKTVENYKKLKAKN